MQLVVQYLTQAAIKLPSGCVLQILLGLSDVELESALKLESSLHRRKMRLAIEELRDPDTVSVYSHRRSFREQGLGPSQTLDHGQYVYPRNATLAWVLAGPASVYLSVCHKSVFYRNG